MKAVTGISEAMKWFHKAADQGDIDSQYILGTLYSYGENARQDFVSAYTWLSLAAEAGDEDAKNLRDEIAEYMTATDILAAKALIRTWKKKMQ